MIWLSDKHIWKFLHLEIYFEMHEFGGGCYSADVAPKSWTDNSFVWN